MIAPDPDPHSKPQILGMGTPIVDHIAKVPYAFLTKMQEEKGGSFPISEERFFALIAALPHTPLSIPGGSCANTIKGLARLGENTSFFGKIGRDPPGSLFQHHLQEANVKPLLTACNTPTAQVISLVTPDGDRTQRSFLGASDLLNENDLHPSLFKGVHLVCFEGYQIRNGQLLQKAMHMAKQTHALISLDLGSYELVDQYRKQLLTLLAEKVDVLFGNEREIQTLMNSDVRAACTKLQTICPVIVALMGKKGCVISSKNTQEHYPVPTVPVLDTTGAGDLFASGFLSLFMKKKPLNNCAAAGNILGSTVVQSLGAEIPKKHWPKLIKQLQSL